MTIKARRRLEIDQVATSIADLSASCKSFAPAKAGTVTLQWLNEEEKVYAKTWPNNVKHSSGLDVLRGWSLIEDRSHLVEADDAPIQAGVDQ